MDYAVSGGVGTGYTAAGPEDTYSAEATTGYETDGPFIDHSLAVVTTGYLTLEPTLAP